MTRSLSSSLVTREVLDRVASALHETLGLEHCRIHLLDASGDASDPEIVAAFERGEAPARADSPRAAPRKLALPIIHGVEPLGALVIEPGETRTLRPEEIAFCRVIAQASAAALKNARHYETLSEIERAKTTLLCNLSHELRTPLSSILLYAELAADGAAQAPLDVRRYLAEIARHAAGLRREIERVLDFSRETLGRERRQIGRVDLAAILEKSVESARDRALGVDFRLDVQPVLHEVFADGPKIERLVTQLLSSVTRRGGTRSVRLSAALAGETSGSLPEGLQPWERLLCVTVFERSRALDPAALEELFRRHPETGNRQASVESGVAMCRRWAALLGGVLSVEDGSSEEHTFRLLLPIQTPR